jgi:hypothetical protein
MTEPRGPAHDALEEVTHAAFNGVFRALEARNLPFAQFGPILIGIIYWPEMKQGGVFQAGPEQRREG